MKMSGFKYRTWDKQAKVMEQYHYLQLSPNGQLYHDGMNVTDKYEILRFTGLKDKNGKEIYEGDIVRISAHPFDIDSNYEVGYNEYMELSCGSYYLSKMRSWAEVIGNIYESPELLGN